MKRNLVIANTLLIIGIMLVAGCIGGDNGGTPNLKQTGSSTVLPLAIVWAEDYTDAEVSVSGGGSSHGINALLNKEADLGDASRLMKGKDYDKVGCPEEDVNDKGEALKACKGVLPTKWVVAYDVLAVVVHPDNTWATSLTYDQLYSIFTDDSPADKWSDVPGLTGAPDADIKIFAPDEASGTYDYFFEEIIEDWGKDTQVASSRLGAGDEVYSPSANDNVILTAINTEPNAIGYFGYAYYKENTNKVDLVAIAEHETDTPVAPSLTNVAEYPMSRPLHVYTDANADNKADVEDYLAYVLSDEGQKVVPEVGYVQLGLVDKPLLDSQRAKLG